MPCPQWYSAHRPCAQIRTARCEAASAADWSPCCASLSLRCVRSICRSIGKVHTKSSIGSHTQQLISRVKFHDRLLHNSMHIHAALSVHTHYTYNVCIKRLTDVQQIHFIHGATSHVRNRNYNTYQSQNFGSVSANDRLPDWHWKKSKKIWRKHRITWILVSIERASRELSYRTHSWMH